ncbi:MAG: CHAT domain-containing protein, partial [Myxococcales bacterium]|nr:CHAT domain-containing protein [Myxococcales bacterium]
MVGAAGSRAAGGATRAIVALALLLGAPGCSACESLFSASPAATAGSVWRRQAEQRSAADDVEGAEAAYLKAAELEAGAGAFANAARDAYEAFLVRYPDTKRPDLALADVHQAWAWAEKSDDVALQRRVLRGAFAILYFTGDLQSCQRALALFHDRVDPGDRDALSTWHNNAALLDLEEGQYRAARRHLREAKAIDDALYPGDPSFTISTNLVTVNVELGEVELATSNLTALMAAPQGAKEDPENPVIQYLRVRVARLAGDDAQAVALADLALAKAPDPTWARDLEYERARALEHLGQLDEAAAGYWRSIEHIETLRRDVRIDDLKPASIERHRRPFEALFMLELRRGRPLEALAVVERVEGRSFIDALSRPPLAAPSAPLALDRSQRRAEAFLRLLPELARTESRPAPSPTEVVGALAERHVLVYFRAGGQVWLGVISRARVDFKPIDAPLAELKRWIARLNADLTDREAATRLGQALLPRWALPAPKVTLSLVPDAELHRVPFALLPVEGAALIDRNDLAYAPSAGAIAIAVSRAKEPRRAEPPVVLAAGELQGAQREARWVAQRLGVEAEVGAS